MRRALAWLNLYGREAQKQKKMHFCVFRPFLSLCRTASQPHRLSQINALRIIQSYQPKDQSLPPNISAGSVTTVYTVATTRLGE